MKLLVGLSPDRGGLEALALARVLARSSNVGLVVATIIPATWEPPSMARVDGEYGSYLRRRAAKMQERVKAGMAEAVDADFVIVPASSTAEGLQQAAKMASASCIVVGSSRRAATGYFADGSVGAELLHTSDVPVAVAPKGYYAGKGRLVPRVSCAFAGDALSADLVRKAATWCEAFDVPLRLVTAVIRDRQLFPTGAGYDVENLVANDWRQQAKTAQDEMIKTLSGHVEASGEFADGSTWKSAFRAVPWFEGEVLAVGSSRLGPALRVFLGARSSTVIRSAPVPCLVFPRDRKPAAD